MVNCNVKVNALDLGVVSDGKTDCSRILNDFLNSENNRGKILFLPKGNYYLAKTVVVAFCKYGVSLEIEPYSVINSKAVPCFHVINSNKDLYKRVNKPTARKMYNHGCSISLLPCKINESALYGSYSFIKPVTINILDCKHDSNKFDRTVNDFEYYNCNAESGYYAHYYVTIDDFIKCKYV